MDLENIPVHSKHMLTEFWITEDHLLDCMVFRAPTDSGTNGKTYDLPAGVRFDELREGDEIVIMQISPFGRTAQSLTQLRFGRVLERQNDSIKLLTNILVSPGYSSESIYKRLAGMTGALPCSS